MWGDGSGSPSARSPPRIPQIPPGGSWVQVDSTASPHPSQIIRAQRRVRGCGLASRPSLLGGEAGRAGGQPRCALLSDADSLSGHTLLVRTGPFTAPTHSPCPALRGPQHRAPLWGCRAWGHLPAHPAHRATRVGKGPPQTGAPVGRVHLGTCSQGSRGPSRPSLQRGSGDRHCSGPVRPEC